MKTTTLARMGVVVVVVLTIVLVVVSWVGRNSRPAAAPAPSSTTSTIASLTPTISSVPATPSSEPTPEPTPSHNAFAARVLAFEQAYYLLDPKARKAAVRPYVTDEYFTSLFPADTSESDYLASLREGVTYSLDLDSATINTEEFDATTTEVFTQIRNTSTSDGVSQTMTLTHVTYWVKDKTGTWRAVSEAT